MGSKAQAVRDLGARVQGRRRGATHPEDGLSVLLVPRDTAQGQALPGGAAEAEDEEIAREARKAGARRELGDGAGVDLDRLRLEGERGRQLGEGRVQAVRRGLRGRVDEGRGVCSHGSRARQPESLRGSRGGRGELRTHRCRARDRGRRRRSPSRPWRAQSPSRSRGPSRCGSSARASLPGRARLRGGWRAIRISTELRSDSSRGGGRDAHWPFLARARAVSRYSKGMSCGLSSSCGRGGNKRVSWRWRGGVASASKNGNAPG